jgi:N-carbamoyl-L-amino-acid hydrolase
MTVPKIDSDRLWADIMALAEVTEPGRPYTRRSFTPLFDEGRRRLVEWVEALGATVRVDTGGNLIARIEGTEQGLPAIAIGSHTDTVPAGGRFDGIAGVLAGLAVMRALVEAGERLRHPFELIDCLAEEPSEFGVSCIGSRAIAGQLTPAMLDQRDPAGRRLGDAIRDVGGDPDRLVEARRQDLGAFLEVHIEQGPVLETGALDIGIVSSIVGIRRLEIRFTGEAGHAGTSPMHLRRDAAYAGALALVGLRELAERIAGEGGAYFVATVGIMEVLPGGSNVVPGACRLVVDIRSADRTLTDRFVAELDGITRTAAETARVERTGFDTLSDGTPAECDPGLRSALTQAAAAEGLSTTQLASGAGHDTAFFARVCPAAMIFIPCLKGVSHAPEEYATPEACAAGARVLLETVRRLDAQE